jgi:hypothetical protein
MTGPPVTVVLRQARIRKRARLDGEKGVGTQSAECRVQGADCRLQKVYR